MDRKEFQSIRKFFSRTQKQMAQLLGVSLKAVNSYEQGWRNIPPHVERQLLFLLARKPDISKKLRPCWEIKKCKKEMKEKCPAWEFRAGKICWFINGTICEGGVQKNWKEKIKICRKCKVLKQLLQKIEHDSTSLSFKKQGDDA